VNDLDLSFPNYVASRKGAASARAREGAQYAYGGDLRVRSALDKVRPVTLAVEATLRFWHTVGKNRLLGSSVKVGERQFPHIDKMVQRCSDTLQVRPPTVYVSPKPTVEVQTLGAADDATIVLPMLLADAFSEPELMFVIGRECGHIQNSHTIYLTALYFLTTAANQFVRWGAQPAILALNGWSRRAEITADRAGLLCMRKLDVATGALVKLAIGAGSLYSGTNVDEYLQQLSDGQSGPSRFDELWNKHPYLPKRVEAMRIFAETTYYRSVIGTAPAEGAPGLSKEECDTKVGELLAVFR
jgi:Zn-dependent protease with chaperone function